MKNIIGSFLLLIGAMALVVVISLLLSFPVMWTWNATMPFIFKLPVITWEKAWCLMFLSSCLFKSSFTSLKK